MAKFRWFNPTDDADEQHLSFIQDIEFPVIEEAGKYSKFVNFIIKGKVHIMDPSGLYDYGTLETGGYFGDISCLFGKPNNFSYYYNTN